jgi:hypothetical protein
MPGSGSAIISVGPANSAWEATMTTAARRTQDSGAESSAIFGDALTGLWRSAFLNTPLALASEMARFGSLRLQAQADFWSEIQQAKDMSDVFRAQMSFMQGATQDYSSESGKLIKDVATVSELRKAG